MHHKTSTLKTQLQILRFIYQKTLDFVGPWEVALVEFCYPNSWYNLSGLSYYYLYYRQNAVSATASIPVGYYQNPRTIIQHLLHDLKIKFHQNLDYALAHSSETYVTEPIKFQLTLQYNKFTQKFLLSQRTWFNG